jgi:hypothetical protein
MQIREQRAMLDVGSSNEENKRVPQRIVAVIPSYAEVRIE